MHIPDGYLGPETYVAAYAVAVPFWVAASRKLNKTLRVRQVPMLALGAAFSFLVMMFNVPFPGTTGHAVGAVLVAILLGPWAACIAVSLALIVQALFFGDGGITCIGANCLNMAIIMPFVGYGVYRLIAGRSEARSPRRWIGAALGGYIGINVAALSAGFMFGIQPLLYHDAAGHALYSPYSLNVAIPAVTSVHLLLFGFVEAIITGAVVAYMQRTDPSMLYGLSSIGEVKLKSPSRLWIALVGLVLLSPLGLILPAKFGAGSAWGEWSAEEIKHLVGYAPTGMHRLSGLWKAPMPDYAFKGQTALHGLCASYVVAAILGVAIIAVLASVVSRVIRS